MFANHLNEILYRLLPAKPATLMNMDAWGEIDAETRNGLIDRARKALRTPVPVCLLSDLAAGRPDYADTKAARRDMLIRLVLGGCAAGFSEFCEKIIDIAWLICEESSWGETRDANSEAERDADGSALATSCLLAWTYQLAGGSIAEIAPVVLARIERELTRRVFAPFLKSDAPAWASAKSDFAANAVCALFSAFILACRDDRRRWTGIRRCLITLDEILRCLPSDGFHPKGLEYWQSDCEAFSDAATLLLLATGGEVDVRNDAKFLRLCDFAVSAHMGGGRFVNPDGDAKCALSGETLFRIAESADNSDLRRLGAALGSDLSGSESATALVLGALLKRAYKAQAAIFPYRERVFLRASMLLVSAASGFRAALTGGSRTVGHSDAGDMQLYYKDRPVFADMGLAYPTADMHSLPSVNGIYPIESFGGARDADMRGEDAFTYISINIADSFPDAAGVLSWQRSIMLSPMDKRARIIEAFDLDAPADEVAFHFITPRRPEKRGERALALGDVELSWEGDLACDFQPKGGGYMITIKTPPGATRGNHAFTVSPAEYL